MSCVVVVFHRSLASCVANVDVVLVGNVIEFEVFAIDLVAAVVRGVIGDDQEVVCVVLCEDGVETIFDPEHCVVLIAWTHNAERQFCCKSIDIMY